MSASRPLLRLGAVTAALALTGAGVAVAAVTGGTPTSTDGAFDSAVVASHANHKHGGQDGHLPGSTQNLRLVGQMKVNDDEAGRVADVGVHKGYAYLTAFNDGDCTKGGVYVFDIRNPQAPQQIAFVRGANGSYAGEGSQALTLSTPKWSGDLLLFNNENCTTNNGGGTDHSTGGISLVDVSDPKRPQMLRDGFGDVTPGSSKAHTVHSVFAWQPRAGGPAYAVMVDNEESTDVDIVDISDPRDPVIIAEYDLDSYFTGRQDINDAVKGVAESFLHDMVVKEIDGRQVMLASYWDGGYVTMDVTDPRRAKYIGDTDFAAVDEQLLEATGDSRTPEGNAHQAEFSLDNRHILAADEDFSPFSLVAANVTDGTSFDANSGDGTRQLTPGETITGATTFAGRACNGDPLPAGDGIAVVERGVCTFTEKVGNVTSAGYDAVLIVNRTGSDACSDTLGMSVTGTIPAFGVSPRELAFQLFPAAAPYDEATCRAGDGTQLLPIPVGTTGDVVEFESYFDGWGYVRLFQNGKGKLRQLDTFALPQAHDEAKAVGFGDLSVHEIAFSERDPNLAYVSYYAGGTRVLRIENGKIVDRGHWIDADGSNVWGVQVFEHGGKEYVAASDRDYGLQIFEYTGPGAVNP